MTNKFAELTAFIPKIKDGAFGEWIIDRKNDGTLEHPIQMPFVNYSRIVHEFEKALYKFCEEHPEFEHTRYGDTLKSIGLEWGSKSMEEADVSNVDAKGIIALLMGAVRAERFCDGALLGFFEEGCILRWLERLEALDKQSTMSLIHGSCADQTVDAVVNATNSGLWAGGGICGVIFKKAGMAALTKACATYKTPLKDGSAVITPAFQMTNAKSIIHAVGPDFGRTPKAFKELFDAYYNSLLVLKENGLQSISFPLISSGIFGGALANPAGESTKQACRAYTKFIADYPDYPVEVKLCAFSANEMAAAQAVYDTMM